MLPTKIEMVSSKMLKDVKRKFSDAISRTFVQLVASDKFSSSCSSKHVDSSLVGIGLCVPEESEERDNNITNYH